MRKSHLRAILAIAILVLIALMLWRPSSPAVSLAPAAPSPLPSTVEGSSKPLDESRPGVPVEADRVSARSAPPETDKSAKPPGQYVFDVTFVAVDELGRPMPGTDVDFGPVRQRTNRMGACDKQGELHLKWRANEPQLDGIVSCARGRNDGGIRVRLLADAPCIVRFCGDRPNDPPGDRPQVSERMEALTRNGWGGEVLGFIVDAAGNGVFRDPDLLVQVGERDASELDALFGDWNDVVTSGVFSVGIGRAHGRMPKTTQVDCFVHDATGLGTSDVPIRTFREEPRPESENRTDESGHFVLEQPPTGKIDIEIGGGIFAIQRRTFDLADGKQTWDAQTQRLPIVRGRLIDGDGQPLASWRVQAREDQPPFGFLQGCTTDLHGNFVVGLASGTFARLLASPTDGIDRPAMIVAAHAAAGAEPIELIVRDPAFRVRATWHFDAPAGVIGPLPQARAMRSDSGEWVTLEPCDIVPAGEGRQTWTFQAWHLLPGGYVLTNLGPAGRSQYNVRLGTEDENVGSIPLEPWMQLHVTAEGATEEWGLRVSTRVQGVEVRSGTKNRAGTYFLPSGELELRVRMRDGGPVWTQTIRGTGGERFELQLGDSSTDPVLRAK